jgi:hypothetical protein
MQASKFAVYLRLYSLTLWMYIYANHHNFPLSSLETVITSFPGSLVGYPRGDTELRSILHLLKRLVRTFQAPENRVDKSL